MSVLALPVRVRAVSAQPRSRFEWFVAASPVLPALPALVYALILGSSPATTLLGFLVAYGVGAAVLVVVLSVAVIVLGAPLVRDAIRTRSHRSSAS